MSASSSALLSQKVVNKPQRQRAAVIGAGPVGCLAACMLARHHHYHVDVYDMRSDPRLAMSSMTRSRSINLAVSARGIAAMESIDPTMTERVLKDAIPMKGRMVHDSNGRQNSQNYGLEGECISSINRDILNCLMVDEAESYEDVSIHFQHKLIKSDFGIGAHTFETVHGLKEVKGVDLTVGADGVWSKVRTELMRLSRMNYSQEYIEHAYLEMSIPAQLSPEGEPIFAFDPNHLHIWPRHSFMLIALPNQDKSFTCTLFAPFSTFDLLPPPKTSLQSAKVIEFFRSNFPDACRLIGEDKLVQCFREHPRGSMVTVKCSPYHYRDRAIIIGDAAHSMVPFYGQGMNCGLEDVHKLHNLFSTILHMQIQDDHSPDASETLCSPPPSPLESVLQRYTQTRHEDLIAICGLAMDNYVEMRSSVIHWKYKVEKLVDEWLARLFGLRGHWLPLYTMVTFRPDISYSQALQRSKIQKWWIKIGLEVGAPILILGCLSLVSWPRPHWFFHK